MSANPGALPGWFHRPTGDDALPDSENAADESGTDSTSATQTTTGGGRDDQTPVVVWEAANRMEAEIVAGRLQSEGIPAIIRGEILGAIYGLTTGSLAAATVLVPALLAEKALAILATTVEWDETDAELSDPDSPQLDSTQEHDG